jgi:hypothetical protein
VCKRLCIHKRDSTVQPKVAAKTLPNYKSVSLYSNLVLAGHLFPSESEFVPGTRHTDTRLKYRYPISVTNRRTSCKLEKFHYQLFKPISISMFITISSSSILNYCILKTRHSSNPHNQQYSFALLSPHNNRNLFFNLSQLYHCQICSPQPPPTISLQAQPALSQ